MTITRTIYSEYQQEMEEKEKEIYSHLAWHEDLSGIECEDLLRGLRAGSYLLRRGERRFHYYLSFVMGDIYSFKHQPFLIITHDCKLVFGYRNGAHRWAFTLENFIPIVLHCASEECYPVQKKKIYGK